MPDYLKLAREARELAAQAGWADRDLALRAPALCDAIEAQAAEIVTLNVRLDHSHNNERRLSARFDEQAAEIERLREELGLLCDRLVDNARAVRLNYKLEAGS